MSFYIYIILCVVINSMCITADEAFLPKGLFEVVATGIEKCPDQGTKDVVADLRFQRVNHKRVNVIGNVTIKMKADENIGIEYIFDRWGNGGWRANSYVLKNDYACESLKSLGGKLFEHMYTGCREGDCLKRKSGEPFCPAYAGVYEFTDVDIKEFDSINIPAAQLGKWRLTINVKNRKENKQLGCYRSTINIIQKRLI